MKDTPKPKKGKYPSLSAKRVEQQPKKVSGPTCTNGKKKTEREDEAEDED